MADLGFELQVGLIHPKTMPLDRMYIKVPAWISYHMYITVAGMLEGKMFRGGPEALWKEGELRLALEQSLQC